MTETRVLAIETQKPSDECWGGALKCQSQERGRKSLSNSRPKKQAE